MKVYARQVNPECQDSLLFCGGGWFLDNIVVFGNKDYKEHTLEIFDNVFATLENRELVSILEDIKNSAYNNATAAIVDFLPPTKGKYSNKDIHFIKECLEEYTTCNTGDEDRIICNLLSLVDGEEWDYQMITGNMRGEWNTIYYPIEKWNKETLRAFEVKYFNDGTEWVVSDESEKPLKPEEINEYSIYCISQGVDEIRKEIARNANVDPIDVVLYKYVECGETPIYEELTYSSN